MVVLEMQGLSLEGSRSQWKAAIYLSASTESTCAYLCSHFNQLYSSSEPHIALFFSCRLVKQNIVY